MSQFGGFKESFLKSQSDSVNNSDTISGVSDSLTPPSTSDISKQTLPSINISQDQQQSHGNSNLENLLTSSSDIKKQLSQSFQGGIGGGNISGISRSGISKPHSRRNSTVIKSQGHSDNEDDGDEKLGEGNERKRRDNINEKIQELLTLIPSEFFQDANAKEAGGSGTFSKEGSAASMGDKSGGEDENGKATGTKDGKPNKGQILTKSVEYLQYLQNLIDENNRKEVELIMKLKTLELKRNNRSPDVPIRIGYTSAEKALGEIGVGPCSEEYFRNVLINSANTSKTSRRGST
ncbi:RTG1 [[Candida] subhashii]|uniref:RTG1 n=1 Tax=[Candida] subhashii TaxID=561895 RepID=A0A8J5V0W9_9ASCO|nr:RTG1 [[Candida] subhashii]KAG7663994.1 RTG1 [[Candida] subhashii]